MSVEHPEKKYRFLTVEQVAEELNVGLPLVRGLLKAGELRGLQVGGRGLWRIGRQDLDKYIEGAYAETARRVTSGELADAEHDSPDAGDSLP